MTDPLTLVARLTPAGRSALATLVIDGPSAVAIASSLFQSRRGTSLDDRDPGPHYGWFGIDPKDDVVLTLAGSGESPPVEIHCHGGSAMVEGLIDQVVRAGATRADWQEVLRRRGASEIHLEAIEALGQCGTERGALVLLDQASGALERALGDIERSRSASRARELLAWALLGRHLTEPWRVSLVGRPNVGKSLLLNAILGHERAIVSDIAGTTRDVIDGLVALDGWPVLFSDGAGVRDTDDPIETAGIESIRREAKQADLRVLVLDASTPIQQEDVRLLDEIRPELVVANKVDLSARWSEDDLPVPVRWVSAPTEAGIDELLEEIAHRLVPTAPLAGQAVPFTERQIRWLESRAELDG